MHYLLSLLLPITPLKAGIFFMLFVVVFIDSDRSVEYLNDSAPKNFHVNCNTLVGHLTSSRAASESKKAARFTPNEGQLTYPDDSAVATPQVFKVISSFLETTTQRVVSSHCQAIYTDRSKAFGSNVVEMPAHCFLTAIDNDDALVTTSKSSRLMAPLKNYCVYMGQDIRHPEAFFSPKKIACQSTFGHSNQDLRSDSCMVFLDKPVPESIVNKPLVWWRASLDTHIRPEGKLTANEQFLALMGAETEQISCNLDAGYTEASTDLQMISHSIDFDDFGAQRVMSLGKPIYHHPLRGIILNTGQIPNTIDTRSGDSGAAVVIVKHDKKLLIGMQVAIMLASYYQGDQPTRDTESSTRFQGWYYNMAINPHFGASGINRYSDVYY